MEQPRLNLGHPYRHLEPPRSFSRVQQASNCFVNQRLSTFPLPFSQCSRIYRTPYTFKRHCTSSAQHLPPNSAPISKHFAHRVKPQSSTPSKPSQHQGEHLEASISKRAFSRVSIRAAPCTGDVGAPPSTDPRALMLRITRCMPLPATPLTSSQHLHPSTMPMNQMAPTKKVRVVVRLDNRHASLVLSVPARSPVLPTLLLPPQPTTDLCDLLFDVWPHHRTGQGHEG